MTALLTRVVAFSLVIAASAPAQFPGDVFFEDPAPLVVEGGTVALGMQVFLGASAFGAARFDVAFDRTELELAGVEASVGQRLVWRPTTTGLAIVVLNGRTLDSPIGTVPLGNLLLRPLGVVGQNASVTLGTPSLLGTSVAPLPAGAGFSATVTVIAATDSILEALPRGSEAAVDPGWRSRQRSRGWRRPGSRIRIPVRLSGERWVRVPWTIDAPGVEGDIVPDGGR